MKFKLSCLPFETNALEPYISGKTLEFHHDKHLQAYNDITMPFNNRSKIIIKTN